MVNNHQSPDFIHRYPGLLWIQHLVSWLMTLRLWFARREMRRSYEQMVDCRRILDIGCGSGEVLFSMAKRYKTVDYVGLDLNQNATSIAHNYATTHGMQHVSFVSCRIEDYHPSEHLDIISCISVLHYIEDPGEMVKRMAKALQPNGRLIINIPIEEKRLLPGYKWIRRTWFKSVAYDADYRILLELKEEDLARFIADAGLEIELKRYTYGFFGKIAFELFSFGQLFIMRANWLIAVLFSLVYFSVVAIPAWILMLLDFYTKNHSGNGIMLTCRPITSSGS